MLDQRDGVASSAEWIGHLAEVMHTRQCGEHPEQRRPHSRRRREIQDAGTEQERNRVVGVTPLESLDDRSFHCGRLGRQALPGEVIEIYGVTERLPALREPLYVAMAAREVANLPSRTVARQPLLPDYRPAGHGCTT